MSRSLIGIVRESMLVVHGSDTSLITVSIIFIELISNKYRSNDLCYVINRIIIDKQLVPVLKYIS